MFATIGLMYPNNNAGAFKRSIASTALSSRSSHLKSAATLAMSLNGTSSFSILAFNSNSTFAAFCSLLFLYAAEKQLQYLYYCRSR